MSNYFDSLGFLHDKPCIDGEPSSNNKFLYSAHGLKTGFIKSLNREMLKEMYYCWENKVRHSRKAAPPFSRDEAIGLCYLNPYFAVNLIQADFWMTNNRPSLKPFRFIYQLILLIINRKDRNYWWQNDLDQMKFLTMRLPRTDRAFIYKLANKKPPYLDALVEKIDMKQEPSGRSSRAIRSFKYNQDNFEGIMLYFNLEHPLRKYLEEKRNATR